MKITNKLGLPTPFVTMASSDYQYTEGRYSATALLKGVREIMLERRHHFEIEQDVSEMIWMIFGQAVHSILEKSEESEHQFKEVKLAEEINERIVSGQFDLYDAKTKTLDDYKTCSVWKVIYGDYEDWRLQLLIYAYLLTVAGFPVDKVRVIALMKDHSKAEAGRKDDYPPETVKIIEWKVTEKELANIESYLKAKIEEIKQAEKLPDDELPICSEKERFNSGDKYAIMKKGNKRAVRVLDTEQGAKDWLELNGDDKMYIEVRKGIDKKCIDYCRCNKFCNYYNEVVKGEQTDELGTV